MRSKVARSYAEALAGAAADKGQLAVVAEELAAFNRLVRDSEDLRSVFASPAIAPAEKMGLLDAIIERTRPNTLMGNFLRVLLRNNRLHEIAAIQRAFADELDRREGVVEAEVTAAKTLTDAERAALESRLTALTGKKVRLSFSMDPDLIGGAITRIGSVIYDGSIRTQLETIRRRMTGQARP